MNTNIKIRVYKKLGEFSKEEQIFYKRLANYKASEFKEFKANGTYEFKREEKWQNEIEKLNILFDIVNDGATSLNEYGELPYPTFKKNTVYGTPYISLDSEISEISISEFYGLMPILNLGRDAKRFRVDLRDIHTISLHNKVLKEQGYFKIVKDFRKKFEIFGHESIIVFEVPKEIQEEVINEYHHVHSKITSIAV